MKILTTALFSVLLLGKKISRTQWVAVGILTLAVALVQVCMYYMLCSFVCAYVCLSVCLSVNLHLCVYESQCVCMCVSMCLYVSESISLCVHL